MERSQFKLALTQLGPGDYEEFEHLASANAVIEYGQLRTIAATSGDGGRDALLFSPVDDETYVLQYSVSTDWDRKIRRTAKRINATVPTARVLIYVTPVEIGNEVDELKKTLRKDYGLFLDVWPRSWLLDRLNTHPQRETAARRVVELKVAPLLKSAEVVSDQAQALSGREERCAVVYLTLQAEDERAGKGLSRVCFESVVRAALRGTSASNTMTKEAIHARVFEYVVQTDENVRHIDRALNKMLPRVVKQRADSGEYHLAHDEQMRLQARLAEQTLLKESYLNEMHETVSQLATAFVLTDSQLANALDIVPEIVDRTLLAQGELFASALAAGSSADLDGAFLDQTLSEVLARKKLRVAESVREVSLQAASNLLFRPTPAVQAFLSRWSESYTLFALLKSTPDMQKVASKMYGHGRLWLDTNVLLPVIAETLLPEDSRQFTTLLTLARQCGLTLHVTDGVVEELSSQMGKSLLFARYQSEKNDRWIGDVPFLYAAHAISGQDPSYFGSWIDEFRGRVQPDEDVAIFLSEEFHIERTALADAIDSLPDELRIAVQEKFYAMRGRHTALDPVNVDRLVNHDIECFLGVMAKRKKEQQSPLGFNAWWLTLDRAAVKVQRQIQAELVPPPPPSPVMSPDFLVRYLEIGPLRQRASRSDDEYKLPIIADIAMMEGVSFEVLEVATRVRLENEGRPRRAIQRKIRDTLNSTKMRPGRLSRGGADSIKSEVLDALEAEAVTQGRQPRKVDEAQPAQLHRLRRRARRPR